MTERTPPSTPVVPKPAASLLVLRVAPLSRKAEVLMGMRGAKHKFMPNRLVFPGGRVDPEDHGVAPASEMPELTWRRLLRGADESLARAIGIAAKQRPSVFHTPSGLHALAQTLIRPGKLEGHAPGNIGLIFGLALDQDGGKPLVEGSGARGSRAREGVENKPARRGDQPAQPLHQIHRLHGRVLRAKAII